MKGRRYQGIWAASIVAVALAAPAHADAGTGMMWLGMAQLLVGNLLIGCAEWAIVSQMLPRHARYGMAGPIVLIAANYLSAWVGVLLLLHLWPGFIATHYPQPIVQARSIIAASWLALFIVTVLSEWGFVHAAVSVSRAPWTPWRSLVATVVINVISYAGLLALYWKVTPTTLISRTHIVAPGEIARGLPARLYYLSDRGELWVMRLDGSERRLVQSSVPFASSHPTHARMTPGLMSLAGDLALVANPKCGRLDLYLDRMPAREGLVFIAPNVGRVPEFHDPEPKEADHRDEYDGSYLHRRATVDLRPAGQTKKRLGAWEWPAYGITFGDWRSEERREGLRLALETPFLALTPKSPTILQNDVAVLQYSNMFGGSDEIVLLDLRSLRLAWLANGRSPVVVLDELPAGVTWWQPRPGEDYREDFKRRLRGM